MAYNRSIGYVRPKVSERLRRSAGDGGLARKARHARVRCFAENKIDLSVLPHLTDQDLKDIGVPLGHRRKMLAAISEVAADTASEPKVFEPEPKPQETAERRQVTVLFSDLVGSTAPPSGSGPV